MVISPAVSRAATDAQCVLGGDPIASVIRLPPVALLRLRLSIRKLLRIPWRECDILHRAHPIVPDLVMFVPLTLRF